MTNPDEALGILAALTPKQRDALKGREAAVWAAAYSAHLASSFFGARGYGFDRACEEVSAEEAITFADVAVYKMQTWEHENE